MAHSLAVLRVLEREGGFRLADRAVVVAGHSLGEYSALAAAGAFEPVQAARLLRLRGQAMQKAVPAGVGAMAALIGVEMELASEICAEAAEGPEGRAGGRAGQRQRRRPGGDLRAPGGGRARDRGGQAPRACGGRMLLPVSAPFHCALMAPAAEAMAEALERLAAGRRRWCRWWPTSPPPRPPTPARSCACWCAR